MTHDDVVTIAGALQYLADAIKIGLATITSALVMNAVSVMMRK